VLDIFGSSMPTIENLGRGIRNVLAPNALIYSFPRSIQIARDGRQEGHFIRELPLALYILGMGIIAEVSPYVGTYLTMIVSDKEMTPMNMLTEPDVVRVALFAFSLKTILNNIIRYAGQR